MLTMLFLCPLTVKCFADLLVRCLNLCVTMKKLCRLDAYEQKGIINQGQGIGRLSVWRRILTVALKGRASESPLGPFYRLHKSHP